MWLLYLIIYLHIFIHNLMHMFWVLDMIMLRNLLKVLCSNFFSLKAFITRLVVPTHHNGMVWWNANTCIFQRLQEVYFCSQRFLTLFWGHNIMCSAYLINIMPLSNLNNISPFEKLYNIAVVLDHLRTFEGLCYISTPKVLKTKYAPRAQPTVFIGYSVTQKRLHSSGA